MLLLDVPAPALGEHVALAARPVRVPEPPWLAGLVVEGQEQALLPRVAAKREASLGVLLGDHQPVELAYIAGREGLLKQVLLLVVVLLVVQVRVHGHAPWPCIGVLLGERIHGHPS
ncbi:hypothetical protein CFC21_061107 [Triticum aestivum]|uniref:Uncharacterized protein n=2 Tax=Triticum aestivum TaxID=4565 RepID=A0A9R1GT83_WHEAT|nr:hypothetical protein CFC21_061107 [Triticum aestivum]